VNIVIFRHMIDTWLAIYKISVYNLTVHILHVRYKRPKKAAVELRVNIMAVRHLTDTWLAIYKILVYTLTVHTLHVCYKRPMKEAVEERVNIVFRHIKSTYINYQSLPDNLDTASALLRQVS